jgi:glycine cleavage system H lipoate-binding protein
MSTVQTLPWAAADDQILFWGKGWFRLGQDATLRVGMVPPRGDEQAGCRLLWLPSVGERIYQGLPMAGLADHDGGLSPVPAPVSGQIADINPAVTDGNHDCLVDPCGQGWLMRLQPSRFAAERYGCRSRRVVLATADHGAAASQRKILARLGCLVSLASTPNAVLAALCDGDCQVLILDAETFDAEGPRLVGEVRTWAPEVRIVVLASRDARHEADYRARKVFYYAVSPFEDLEIVDILDAAFSPSTRPCQCQHRAALNCQPMDGMRVSTRSGTRISVVVADGWLDQENGLGRALLVKLKHLRCSVQAITGPSVSKEAAMKDERGRCDAVLFLEARDLSRPTGSLRLIEQCDSTSGTGEPASGVRTLAVQEARPGCRLDCLGPALIEVLAEHIAREITSC